MGKLTDDDMTAAEGSDDKFLEKVPMNPSNGGLIFVRFSGA